MKKPILIFLQLMFMLSLTGYDMGLSQNLIETKQKALKTPQGTWKYSVRNSGNKAILFIHGANSSKSIWKNQHTISLKGYKNIFVDLLGYGESDKPNTGYNLTNWIEGIHLILESEGVDEICIVAHSNGVIFAKEYYRTYPDKIANLILIDGMLKQMIGDEMLDWMKSTLEKSDYKSFMENSIKGMPIEGLSEQDVEILKKDAMDTPKVVAMAEFKLVSDSASWHDLIIHCPVTIVHANSSFWTDEYVEWLKTIAPGHHFIEWNDAGHFIQMQYPDRLNRLITELVLPE